MSSLETHMTVFRVRHSLVAQFNNFLFELLKLKLQIDTFSEVDEVSLSLDDVLFERLQVPF